MGEHLIHGLAPAPSACGGQKAKRKILPFEAAHRTWWQLAGFILSLLLAASSNAGRTQEVGAGLDHAPRAISRPGPDGEYFECTFKLDRHPLIEGVCEVTTVSEETTHYSDIGGEVWLMLSKEQEGARAYWNEGNFATHAHADLGIVKNDESGDCWINDRVWLCLREQVPPSLPSSSNHNRGRQNVAGDESSDPVLGAPKKNSWSAGERKAIEKLGGPPKPTPEEFARRGAAFSDESTTFWSTTEERDPLTDKTRISVLSKQESGDVVVSIKGSCVEPGSFAFEASLFNQAGENDVRIENGGRQYTLKFRYNDQIVDLFGASQYFNLFQLAWVVSTEAAEELKPMVNLYETPPTMVSMLGLPPTFVEDRLWRVSAQVQTNYGLVSAELPLLRPEIQAAIRACMMH